MEAVALDDVEDAALAGRAADGDIRAFGAIVRRHSRLMRVHARRLLGSDADVDDVVQESFVTAWQRLSYLEDDAAVRPWLMRVVTNKAMDRIRARRESTTLDGVDREGPAFERPERVAEARSATEHLRRTLAALPEEQRRCWVMREAGGCSYDEIADELGLPVSTVRGMLSRVRRRLADEMKEWR